MALVLEDGTGVTGANSYATLADALAYHADHGNAAWAASTDPLRTAALIRASAAADARCGASWRGVKLTGTQGLDWPRSGAWDRDGYPLTGVPAALVAGVCEAALVELDNPGALTKKAETGLKSQTIGSISQTWTGASSAGSVAYPAVFAPLSRLMRDGRMGVRG